MYGVTRKTSDPPFFVGSDMVVGAAVKFESSKQANDWLDKQCRQLNLKRENYRVLPMPKGKR